jgi:hypothetical protein
MVPTESAGAAARWSAIGCCGCSSITTPSSWTRRRGAPRGARAPAWPTLEWLADEYVTGDLDADFGALRIDVTTCLPFADASFEALICNHVLEHVPDDRRAVRELRRMLSPGGWAILLVPDVAADAAYEDPSVVTPAERRRGFGQEDQVRRYGWDYLDRLRSAGFRPEVVEMGSRLPAEALARHRLRKFSQVEPLPSADAEESEQETILLAKPRLDGPSSSVGARARAAADSNSTEGHEEPPQDAAERLSLASIDEAAPGRHPRSHPRPASRRRTLWPTSTSGPGRFEASSVAWPAGVQAASRRSACPAGVVSRPNSR